MMRRATLVLLALSALATRGIAQQRPPASQACDPVALRREVDALNQQMIERSLVKREDVADFYLTDATIQYSGGRYAGRDEIRRYWTEGPAWKAWTLDVSETGGGCDSPWVRGRSTLTSESGRAMATDFLAILKRDREGRLRYYLDTFVMARP